MYTPRLHLRTALVLLSSIGLALLAARAASAGGACHLPPNEGTTATVRLSSLCFSPTVARIEVGSTVEFVNLGQIPHNVVGHGAAWGEFADIAPGDTVTARFDTAGIHPFSCTLHPGMVGAVVVGDATAREATPPESGWGGLRAAAAVAIVVGAGAALRFLPGKPDVDQRPQGRIEWERRNPAEEPVE